MLARLALVFSALLAVAAPPASAGLSLERNFGQRGVATPQAGPTYEDRFFSQVEVGPDRTILVEESRSGGESSSVQRYTADGRRDAGSGPRGLSSGKEAVDSKGRRLVVSGGTVKRLNPDGSPDAGFGARPNEPGVATPYLRFQADLVLPLSSGRIAVAGRISGYRNDETYTREIAVALLEEDGELAAGFGNAGVVLLGAERGVEGEELVAMLPRGDGLAIALNTQATTHTGPAQAHSASVLLALRLDGALDPAFADGGALRSQQSIEALASTPDGRLLIAGNRWLRQLPPRKEWLSDVYVTRLDAAGAPDPGFGSGGTFVLSRPGIELAHSLLLEADGSVLLGGATTMVTAVCDEWEWFCRETPLLTRLRPNGTLDPEFGEGGTVLLRQLEARYAAPGDGRGVFDLAQRPDGAILAAGGYWPSAFLALLDDAGRPVPDFGDRGIAIHAVARRSDSGLQAIDVDSRGRVLVAGHTNAGGWGAGDLGTVFRFTPDGRPDRSFGEGKGYVRVPGNARRIAAGLRGDVFVLSGKYATNAVTHVTAKGTIDPRFGVEGTAELPEAWLTRRGKRHWLDVDPTSIAALPDGGVVVGADASGIVSYSRIEVIRLDRRGRPASGFGRRGVMRVPFGKAGEGGFRDLEVQSDGRVLLTGWVRRGDNGPGTGRFAVIRLLADGRPDPSFSGDGLAVAAVGKRSYSSALAVQRGGSIVVAGMIRYPGREGPVLLRFGGDGRPDPGFERRAAGTSPPTPRGGVGEPPREVLAFGNRIVAFSTVSPTGVAEYRLDGSFIEARALGEREKSEHNYAYSVAMAQQGRQLILASNFRVVFREGFELRRYSFGRSRRR